MPIPIHSYSRLASGRDTVAGTSTQTDETERLWGGYAGRLLAVIFFGTMANMAVQFVLPPLLPFIIEDLQITTSQAGFALTALAALVAVGQYPGGRLSDLLSHRTVLVASALLMFLGLGVMSGAIDYATFLVGILVMGIGVGLYQTASFAQLAELYVRRRGQAFGINAAAFDVGGAAAAGIAVAAIAVATWRTAFVPLLVSLLVLTILLHRFNDQPYVVSRAKLDVGPTVRRLFADSSVRRTLVGFSLYMFVWQGSTNFLPAFLQAEKSFSPLLAGNVFVAVLVIGAFVKPTAGVLGDRFGEAEVAAGMPLICGLGVAVFLLAEGTIGILVGVAIYAIGMAAYFPLMSTYLINILPQSSQGGDFGAARTVLFGVGSLGPAFVGTTAESINYGVAYWAFVACLVGCAAATALVARSRQA